MKLDGIFSMLSGCAYKGYEIHMGQTMLMGMPGKQMVWTGR